MVSFFGKLVLCSAICLIAGCGDPPLFTVTGKVTLGGRPYERLLVYFHPLEQEPSQFTIGVGETDATGKLVLRSSAGNGLASGKYRVSFACYVAQGSKEVIGLGDDKADDDRKLVTKNLVPEIYGSDTESPVEFEIKRVPENVFEFDIPRE